MSEQKVLAAIMADRQSFYRVEEFLDDKDFSAMGSVLLRSIKQYYKIDTTAKRVDKDLLIRHIDKTLGNAKKLDSFKEVIEELPYDIGSVHVIQDILDTKRSAAADRLCNALAERSTQSLDEVGKHLEEYIAVHEASDLESTKAISRYEVGIADLFSKVLSDENKIKLLPTSLNNIVGGGAYPGHCIIVFGRVEMGKSMFVMNMGVGFVRQNLKTLFIENEDSVNDTTRRFTQRLIKRDRKWCDTNPEQAEERAKKLGIDNFILTDQPETLQDVEAAIKYFDPDVVIINQMRNMVKGDNQVSNLDALAHDLRRLGKKHNKLMVLVTAAREGETDRNGYIKDKPFLETADVYSSKTGIPAAGDLLIGWGGSDDMHRAGQGACSVCKNKLVDKGGHERFYCTVDPAIGLIEGS